MRSYFPILILALSGFAYSARAEDPKPEKKAEAKTDAKKWQELFDGKTLKNWEIVNNAGTGAIEVKDGEIILGQGERLTGIRYTGKDVPRIDYEIEVKARKLAGMDFFAGITFPYLKEHATWVLGGWGGSVVGISSINGYDAYDNETMEVRDFDMEKYYTLRLQVTEKRLVGYIGKDDQVVNVDVEGKRISMRFGDIEDSVPVGISSFMVRSGIKSVRIRKLAAKELEEIKKMEDDLPF